MDSAPRIRICPPLSCCPTSAHSRSAVRNTGGALFCRPLIKAPLLRWKGRGDSRPKTSSQRNARALQAQEMEACRVPQSPVHPDSSRVIPIFRDAWTPTNSLSHGDGGSPDVDLYDGENEKTRDYVRAQRSGYRIVRQAVPDGTQACREGSALRADPKTRRANLGTATPTS